MTTLNNGTDTITPTLVTGFQATNSSRTIIHPIILGGIDVSILDDDPRAGSLELFFDTEADAEAARVLLAVAAVWTLTDPDVAAVGMTFVREGSMRIQLNPETRTRWTLDVGFQEVSA